MRSIWECAQRVRRPRVRRSVLARGIALLALEGVLAMGSNVNLAAAGPAGPAFDARYERFPQTPLVGGAARQAVIVVPRGPAYAAMAGKLNAALPEPLPVIEEDLVSREGLWPWHVVALGNLMTNRVLGDLYLLERVCCDARFPGEDGYVLRSIHNPFLNGRNVIEVGGSTEAGVARAAERLAQILAEKGPVLSPLLEVSLPEGAPERNAVASNREAYEARLADRDPSGLMALVANCLRSYSRTGDPEAAALLNRATEPFLELARRLVADAAAGREVDGDMPMATVDGVPMAWQAVEDLPAFSDADRAAMAEGITLLASVSWLANRDYQVTPNYRSNHRGIIASFLLGLYVARHFPDNEAGRRILERADRYYTGNLRSWKPVEDASFYAAINTNQTLRYARLRPAWHWFDGGPARQWAEYCLRLTDNRGYMPGMGDGGDGPLRDTLTALCAWRFRDGRLAWALDRGAANRTEFITDVPRVAPADLVGINVLPLDQWIYDRTADYLSLPQAYETAKKAIPRARTYDKLVLRAGLEPGDAYCLLSGFNYGHHSHMDANAICTFVDRGQLFLFDHGYMVEQLQEHCTLAIVRDGVWRRPPEVAELAAVGDFPRAGLVASTLRDNNGVDWTRHVIWAKGRAFIVIDGLQAREGGTYGVQAVWRSRGAVEVNPTGMTALREGVRFRLVHPSGATIAPRECAFQFRELDCGALYESLGLSLKAGEKTHLENVFWAEAAESPAPREIRRRAPGLVLMRDADGLAAAGVERLSLGEVTLEAATFLATESSLSAAGARRLSLPGLTLEAEGDVSFEWDLAGGVLSLAAREPSSLTLSGRVAAGVLLDGRPAGAQAAVAPGTHALTLGAATAPGEGVRAALAAAWFGSSEPRPAAAAALTGGAAAEKVGRVPVAPGAAGKVTAFRCADLDGDGDEEILVATLGGEVRAIDSKGETALALALESGCNDVVGVDLDGDGRQELLCGTPRGEVVCFSSDGKERWRYTVSREGWISYGGLAYPEVIRIYPADLDQDGRPEIVAAAVGLPGFLIGLSGDGKLLWRGGWTGRYTTDGFAALLPGQPQPSVIIGNNYNGADRVGAAGKTVEKVAMTWHSGPERVALGTVPRSGQAFLGLGDLVGRIRFVRWLPEEGRFDAAPESGATHETGGAITVVTWAQPARGEPFWVAASRNEHAYLFRPEGEMVWGRPIGDVAVQAWLDEDRPGGPALSFLTEKGEVHALSLEGKDLGMGRLPGAVAQAGFQ
ncbi:MAG: VCBS repeat-containing protein, partial [Armatimonadetes bacterium]|nr:VCBS repeat-containing protein [Armatimonadota bacterium]